MSTKKEENIMLVVLGLIATPNMLYFVVKSFRGNDSIDIIFGYLMAALYLFMWVMVVIEIIKYRRGKNKED